jgi:hypothetical protein
MRRALRPIEYRLDRIENGINLLRADMKRVKMLFLYCLYISEPFVHYQVLNAKRNDGDVIHFDIVPFRDGSDPTRAPVSWGLISYSHWLLMAVLA